MRQIIIVFLGLITLSPFVFSGNTKNPKSLYVLFGQSRPPFIDEKTQNGLSMKIFRVAMTRLNQKFHSDFVSNARMEALLQDKEVDVAVEVQPDSNKKYIYYSDRFISYRNHFIYRENLNINPTSYADLKSLRVCAWQNARENLGETFAQQIVLFKSYQEFSAQELQVKKFLVHECDVALMDDTIFKYYRKSIAKSNPAMASRFQDTLKMSPLPGEYELWWYVGFKDKTLRDQFNSVLSAMKKDGSYDENRQFKD